MTRRLKLRQAGKSPESFVALEYESDKYLSYAHVTEIPDVSWQSPPLPTEAVIALLRDRGWHTTDIGDELDEARRYAGNAT